MNNENMNNETNATNNAGTINITYLNRDGSGFAERKTLPVNTTVATFLAIQGVSANNYKVRIHRADTGSFAPAPDENLLDGDRVNCVPDKIKGA